MSKQRGGGDAGVPSLHEILKGEVASLQTYGAFIKIPGCEKQGLVHISQISSSRVENPSDVLEKGESIWCKVISVSDGKIGLSMKLVSQTSGKDLDPSNVQSSLDEQKRKTGHRYEKAPIQLEAVYDTKCRKCGGSGHLAQDCFHAPGGKRYDLLEEEEKPIFAGPNQLIVDQQKKQSKHKKKKEKHKKKKHKREASSDSESDSKDRRKKRRSKRETSSDSESDVPKDKQKKKTHKREASSDSETDRRKEKHKKKKHKKETSSESESDAPKSAKKKRKHSHKESDSDEPKHKKKKDKHKKKRKRSSSSPD